MDYDKYELTVKPVILIVGLTIMVVTALLFIFTDDIDAKGFIGLGFLMLIGFGMTVGGSPQRRP